MIHFLRLMAGWAAACAFTTASYGLTITFSDFESGYPLKFLTGSESYTSNFDIRDNGVGSDGKTYKLTNFKPGELTLKSFTVEFWFADDKDSDREKVSVFLGGTGSSWIIFDQERVYGSHDAPPTSYDSIFREFTYSDPAEVKFLDALLDGQMSFKVKATTGDTYLKQGKIVATFCIDEPVSVPEAGSTLTFLMLALAGMGAVRRRREFLSLA